MRKIAIIGAGLAGLVLARHLRELADIVVLEKSARVGGRMSTRQAETYAFDHGAQYFTAKTEPFQAFLKDYERSGCVADWHPRTATLRAQKRNSKIHHDNRYYVGVPTMSAFCQAVSTEGNIYHNLEVSGINRNGSAWFIEMRDGGTFGPFDWVVSTAPAHQTTRIFPSEFQHHERMMDVNMSGCFALMLGFRDVLPLPWDVARVTDSAIGWIAVNSSKPRRPPGFSLLVHATNEWADSHLDWPKESVTKHLGKALRDIAGIDVMNADYMSLHRWRYAGTVVPANAQFLLDSDRRLAACGDWCIDGRVEAAFSSASGLAKKLIELVK